MGVVLTPEAGLTGIDLDNCVGPATGRADDWAVEAAGRLPGTYFEYSPSGRGWRGFVDGHPPPATRKRVRDIEAYTRGRFLTVTGRVLPGRPLAVTDARGGLAGFATRYLAPPATPPAVNVAGPSTFDGDDAALLRLAFTAKNGAKFARLFSGETSGYSSASEADLALLNMIVFWVGRDPVRVDRLFRRSKLWRPKWDVTRGTYTYGELTVAEAIRRCPAVFDPSKSADYDSRPLVSGTLLFHTLGSDRVGASGSEPL